MAQDLTFGADTAHAPALVFEVLRDLGVYPKWLDIIGEAVPDESLPGVWSVSLRAQLGPFRRAKRLRMVRTEETAPTRVVFEREELDGRDHSPWVMVAQIEPPPDGGDTKVEMRLHYGGSLFVPVLDRILSSEVRASVPRLQQYLDARAVGR